MRILPILLLCVIILGCVSRPEAECSSLPLDQCSSGCEVCPTCFSCMDTGCHSKDFCQRLNKL